MLNLFCSRLCLLRRQIKKRARALYWTKRQLLAHREVVELNAQALLAQLFKLSQIISRAEPGKCQEIADQVRLVKVAIFERQLCPVRFLQAARLVIRVC